MKPCAVCAAASCLAAIPVIDDGAPLKPEPVPHAAVDVDTDPRHR